jgi:hypothetical protein
VTIEDGGAGDDRPDERWRRTNRRSNWIQATVGLGFIGVVAVLDWVLNGRLTYVIAIAVGLACGLVLGAVRRTRRRRSRRP